MTGAKGGILRETWVFVREVTLRPVEAYERLTTAPSPRGALVWMGFLGLVMGLTAVAVALARGEGVGRIMAAFVLWSAGGVFGVYLAASALIWLVARALGSCGTFETFVTAWAGSYVPTVVWYAGLVLGHALFKPSGLIDPAILGRAGPILVQLAFLAFSLAAFLWKLLLLYLTLRVAGKLDFRRIVAAAALLAPVALGYWFLGLYFSWFQVPFI